MARYKTDIDSRLPPEESFAYMADFANARSWDPSVSSARKVGEEPLGVGSAFELVARFGGRDVELTYTVLEYGFPQRVVLEARRPGYVSRDTITVEAAPSGSTVHYDALLAFGGVGRVLEPVFGLLFRRLGDRAKAGLQAALNP